MRSARALVELVQVSFTKTYRVKDREEDKRIDTLSELTSKQKLEGI